MKDIIEKIQSEMLDSEELTEGKVEKDLFKNLKHLVASSKDSLKKMEMVPKSKWAKSMVSTGDAAVISDVQEIVSLLNKLYTKARSTAVSVGVLAGR